jgi:hypothetical protein
MDHTALLNKRLLNGCGVASGPLLRQYRFGLAAFFLVKRLRPKEKNGEPLFPSALATLC